MVGRIVSVHRSSQPNDSSMSTPSRGVSRYKSKYPDPRHGSLANKNKKEKRREHSSPVRRNQTTKKLSCATPRKHFPKRQI